MYILILPSLTTSNHINYNAACGIWVPLNTREIVNMQFWRVFQIFSNASFQVHQANYMSQERKTTLLKINFVPTNKSLWVSGSSHIILEHTLLTVCFASSSSEPLRQKEKQKKIPAVADFLS